VRCTSICIDTSLERRDTYFRTKGGDHPNSNATLLGEVTPLDDCWGTPSYRSTFRMKAALVAFSLLVGATPAAQADGPAPGIPFGMQQLVREKAYSETDNGTAQAFRKGDRPLSGIDDETLKAVDTYATAQDCLQPTLETYRDRSDYHRELRWSEMRSEAVLEVCLFRISASLGSPEETSAWLRREWFTIREVPVRDQRFIRQIDAVWDIEKRGLIVWDFHIKFLMQRIFAYGQYVTFLWDKDGAVYSVEINTSTK